MAAKRKRKTTTLAIADTPDGHPATAIDELDRRLVAALQPDGRRAFADIASELGVSEGTIRQRFKRLVSAGILQVVGVADPFKIGYGTMTMIGVKVSLDSGRSIDAVGAEIALFPEVSYAVMSTGAYDLLVEVIAENNEAFTRFLTDRLHRVPGVTATDAFMLLRVYKMNYGGWRVVPVSDEPWQPSCEP
jgi:Lrp/AsnC family transcriptional regulator, regulator for asnA, asnC and gidA